MSKDVGVSWREVSFVGVSQEKGEMMAFPYRGMSAEGVKVHFYHQTLEEYLDACFAAGLQLQHLADAPTPEGTFKRRPDTLIPKGYHFPFFMILGFRKA